MIATHPNSPAPPAAASPPPAPALPALSPDDAALLSRLFDLRDDFAALAQSTSRTLIDLYCWAASPTIAPWLEFHRRAVSRAHTAAAITALRELLASAPNPIERRRAASTLLRACTGTLGTPVPRSAVPHAPRASSSPSSPGTPESRLAPSRRRLPPFPVSRPTPDLSAADTAALFIDSLAEPDPRTVLATLHAHSAPTAIILGETLPPEPATLVFAPTPVLEQAFREPLHRVTLSPYRAHDPDSPAQPDPTPDDPAFNSRRVFRATLTSARRTRPLHWIITLARHPTGEWRIADLRVDPPPNAF